MVIINQIKVLLGTINKKVKQKTAKINNTPVLVLGNQKSGTTAISTLLAKQAGLTIEWDLTITDIIDIYQGNLPLNSFIEKHRLSFSKDIIKDPNFTFIYSKLNKRFPQAKFVMVVRDPRDNIRSILDRLKLPGNQSILSLSEHIGAFYSKDGWKTVFDSSWMKLDGKNYIDKLAARWNKAVEVYFQNKEKIELIKYEDFMQNKEKAIENLGASLGLVKVNNIGGKIDEQFQPRGYRRDMEWSEFYSEENLEFIETRCMDAMEKLGYTNFRVLDK